MAASLEARIESTDDSILRRQLFDLLNVDGGEPQEFAAREGFSFDRIMDYAELTGAMLNEHGTGASSALFDPRFWENQWISAGQYNRDHDNDTTSPVIYTQIGEGTGVIAEVQNGTSTVPVPLRFTCQGISQFSFNSYSVTSHDRNNLSTTTLSTCPSIAEMNVARKIYDTRLKRIVLLISTE